SRGQGGAPAAKRGRTTLTPARTGARWATTSSPARSVHGRLRASGCNVEVGERRGAQRYLGARAAARSRRPHGCWGAPGGGATAQCFEVDGRQGRADTRVNGAGRRGHGRNGRSVIDAHGSVHRGCLQRLLSHFPQGVVAAPDDLAAYRHG